MAGIRLENIHKRFGSITVIDNINLSIHDGEFFTFVGPSGCGKSTILSMLAGLEEASSGSIYFDDTDVTGLSPKERDVAMVFQSYALYPHMTVYDNIAFPLRMRDHGRSRIESEVARAASMLGLERLLARKPKELSGGQRQRVALGRALVRSPKVFLMDEPLSNLDARLRLEMRGELKRLHRELKTTTVYVTHDQAEALSLSERIAVLDRGAIRQVGTPREVYSEPANLFVAGFIGSPSMNFVPAVIDRTDPLEVECNGLKLAPVAIGRPAEKNAVLGIRPEDVSVSNDRSEGGIAVTVTLVEPAGSFNWVDVEWNSTILRGIASAKEALRPGDLAYMSFRPEQALLFEERSGLRI
ncbi:MAG TPA: ABC transporter ATP-binding protein [Syntrophorhabdaceae bacterium]|nr:ABC transporter ATP-binding protein [Syntrophorhabdaceae bacterium]